MDGFLNENTIFVKSYFIIWLCTHSFGSMTWSWKRIFILKSSNMMNQCSPSFLGGMFWADIDAAPEIRGKIKRPCATFSVSDSIWIRFTSVFASWSVRITFTNVLVWLLTHCPPDSQFFGRYLTAARCRMSPDCMQNDRPSPPWREKELSFYIARHIRI